MFAMPEARPRCPLEFRRELCSWLALGAWWRMSLRASAAAIGRCISGSSKSSSIAMSAVTGLTSVEREELRRLGRENARLKQEREILKRAAVFFAAESETR